ncbi:hypothetical protein I4U23_027333 [Adineta vaga]|nr:hypothetical protein I4U23_027333 [Adineta vaga]
MYSTITLTSSNLSIPRLGYGTGSKWRNGEMVKSIDESLVIAIRQALTLGYRHLDCAEIYSNEESVGEAIRLHGLSRDKLFITSKVYNNIENISKACDDTLNRLGIDYLDLWLIHSPFFDRNKTSLEKVWKDMENLVDNGKVKAIGVSNFQIEHLKELFDLKPKIRPVVNQIELHPYIYKESKDLLAYCKLNNIIIQTFAPLASLAHKPNGPVDRIVNDLAKKYDRLPAQILLKWNLSKGDITITTSNKREHLEDFLKVNDENFQLTDDDINEIDEAGSKLYYRRCWKQQIEGSQ